MTIIPDVTTSLLKDENDETSDKSEAYESTESETSSYFFCLTFKRSKFFIGAREI